jgi:hypothetical protein
MNTKSVWGGARFVKAQLAIQGVCRVQTHNWRAHIIWEQPPSKIPTT